MVQALVMREQPRSHTPACPAARRCTTAAAAMLVYSGVLIVILGFALRLNPLLVVAVAGRAPGES
jgi:hypothetical protein